MTDEGGLIIEDGFLEKHQAKWQPKLRSKRTVYLASLCVVIIVVAIIIVSVVATRHSNKERAKDGPLLALNGAVAADNAVCSEVGKKILVAGGHAVDATVASALCQGVLNPFASGIGGGGIMLIYTNKENSTDEDLNLEIIDMRETAPAAATYNMYYGDTQKSVVGPLAGGVPGELKGMYTAWEKYGKLPWKDVVTPSAKLAANFTVQPLLAQFIQSSLAQILADPDMAAVYAPNGVALKAGHMCANTKLSQTLTLIAESGVDIFYNGSLGQAFAQDIQEAGGILTFQDLQDYKVVSRKAISTYYQGYKVVMPPTPYGGPVVALALNILERFNLAALGFRLDSAHWLVEALKFGFSDRLAMGDPAFVPQDFVQQQMLDKDHAAVLRQRLNLSRTFPPSHYIDLTDEIHNFTDHGTTHISVVDVNRNAVAFTTTVNLEFGARFVSKSTGILLNDEMNDFSISNTSTNDWNLPPSTSNIIVPGKRPLSSMNPCMVFKDNKLFMIAGANGGPRIITSTYQTILNVLSFGKSIYDAVAAPRLYVSFTPPSVKYETGYPEYLVEGLGQKGNEMIHADYANAVQAILVQDDNSLLAVSDARKQGKPAGY